jgi:ABC-type transporter Mla subunit MlaD
MSAVGRTRNWLGPILGIVFSVLLAVGLFFGVARHPHLTFSIRFDDVTGIHERSRVTFLGIPAGYVKSLDYSPEISELAVDVEVAITRKLKIPANVKAYLEPTLLGESTIALRLPAQDQITEKDSNDFPANSGSSALLKNGAQIAGRRSTRLEAIMPGFDDAMIKVIKFGVSAQENISRFGYMIDKAVTSLCSIFLDKGPSGQTEAEALIASLREIIDGPEGQEDRSLRSQLQTIVTNLEISSESIKKLADLESNDRRSLGRVLQLFEDAAKKLSKDAETGQIALTKIAKASDAVTRAAEQIRMFGTKATAAVEEFHNRPFHYLTTTRKPTGRDRARSPTPVPRD